MSTALDQLLHYLDEILQPDQFPDYCPNGLQVEGRDRVARLATGVTASQQLLDGAIAWGADAILVHHGYFWSGEPSEQTVHVAREEGIHFIAAGHHATERFGVQALGEHLAGRFGLEHRFIDIDNPV